MIKLCQHRCLSLTQYFDVISYLFCKFPPQNHIKPMTWVINNISRFNPQTKSGWKFNPPILLSTVFHQYTTKYQNVYLVYLYQSWVQLVDSLYLSCLCTHDKITLWWFKSKSTSTITICKIIFTIWSPWWNYMKPINYVHWNMV